jgi:hypothetical protein
LVNGIATEARLFGRIGTTIMRTPITGIRKDTATRAYTKASIVMLFSADTQTAMIDVDSRTPAESDGKMANPPSN